MVNYPSDFGNHSDDDFLRVSVELITPEMAREYLFSQGANRNINSTRISDYVLRMSRGEWKIGQPIILDENDCLIDGQHRLKAVIKYGKPVEFAMLKGVPNDSKTVMDIGQRRTTSQIAQLSGIDKPYYLERQAILSNAFLGSQFKAKSKTTKRNAANLVGARRGLRSPNAMIALEEEYSDGLDFAMRTPGSVAQKKAVGKGSLVRAVVFRAYYTCSHDRLSDFLDVYYTGETYNPLEDSAALTLRNHVTAVNLGAKKVSKVSDGKIELYKKAEQAIFSFLRKRKTERLIGSDYELFPLADFD
jgi:hypothetical protein